MKKHLIFLLAVHSLLACSPKRNAGLDVAALAAHKDSLRAELIATDLHWCELAKTKGFNHTRVDFAAENALLMRQDAMPLNGKKDMEAYAATHSDSSFTMNWKPLRAQVAVSGDLGYTYGSWKLTLHRADAPDTVLAGNYVTVWEKQIDGSWKFLVDGGNDTPEEVKE